RFTRGLSVNAHYTFSKLMDTGGVGNGAAFTDPSALRDIYKTRLERSVGSFDVPHRLVVTYSFDLPFGKGKPWLHTGAWLDRFVGGWTFFSFHVVEVGRAVAVGATNLERLGGASPSRATATGLDPKLPYDTSIANARNYDPRCLCTAPWFNTS